MFQKPVSRRTLIKALLASGASITALSVMPEKWLKPVVNAGVLPVHAQASLNSGISGTVYEGDRNNPLSGVVVSAHISAGKSVPETGYKMASPVVTTGSSTTTGSNGTYTLPLVPGTYWVNMEYGGCGTGANHGSSVPVNPGQYTTVDQDWSQTSCSTD